MTEKQKKDWSRIKYPDSYISLGIWISILLFLTYSIEYLEIPLDRLVGMLQRMGYTLANRYYPPDLDYIADLDYMEYVLETIQMAYLGSLFGLIITLPLGWLGAFNLTPSRRFVYPVARLVTMGFRAVHEMIWAIIFVSILGFGMLPGVLALTFFCAGFASKLLAEEIESVDMGPVEAVRATGANLFQVMIFGVLPQIRVALTGIAIYTWDVAFKRHVPCIYCYPCQGNSNLRKNTENHDLKKVCTSCSHGFYRSHIYRFNFFSQKFAGKSSTEKS